MNRKTVALVTFLVSALIFAFSTAFPEGSFTCVAVDPSFKEVTVGSNFTLRLNISDAIDLYLWVVTVEWNHSIIEFQEYDEGTFLTEGGNTAILDAGTYPGGIGRLVCTVLGSVPGVDGEGLLVTFAFNAKALGTTPINITFSDLLDSNGQHITHEAYDGVVRVSPPVPPVANFTWSPLVPKIDELVTFNASSSTPNGGTITKYEWEFGDGEYASGQIVTHTYVSADIYTATLNVTDSDGLWDIEEKQVQVVQPHGPEAEFTSTPLSPQTGEATKFDASTSQPGWNGTHDMPITEYRWNFGGAINITTSTPILYYSFISSGIYYVTLTVYAPGATPETDSITHKVTVISVPVGGYSFPIEVYTIAKPLAFSLAIVAIIATVFTMIRRKTHRRTKESWKDATDKR